MLAKAAKALSWLLVSGGLILAGCRKDAPRPADLASSDGGEPVSGGFQDAAFEDSGYASARSVEARALEARRDAGTIDPACEGPAIQLAVAATDERCAVSEREWNALAERDGGASRLRQEARREGDRIVLDLVNGGAEVR